MGKINFTKEHFERMKSMASDMLLNNESVTTKMGQIFNISELMHLTTISTLNSIRLHLAKKIEEAENKDEWVSSYTDSKYLSTLRTHKELVNLIIGWKRYKEEQEEIMAKRMSLEARLKELKESQKTPEDKIKELEEEIKDLNEEELF